ncbi:MAG: energy-coupling factor transporter transmembrane protein EcfT [Oscillospiraceae bacterium]|nr:energy-coupling factor transporter transmembrane protein EcfT [Oscillospiraceae bacterium]
MIKDISLGQYFPGNSLVHKLDPRVKLLLTIAFIVSLFLCRGIIPYAIMTLFLISVIVITKINIKLILKSLKPIFILLLFTSILNIFYTSEGKTLLSFGPVVITTGGIYTALFMVVRIILLVAGTFVMLSYTTSPIMLTDGLESLLSPLKKIKFPVHELSMMMSIALRFIPTLIDETDKIMSAQKSRGAAFDTGGIIKRAKALIPVLIPLFINAFRRADDLALAMECRCYRGGDGRTSLRQLKLAKRDYLTTLVCVIVFALSIFLSHTLKAGVLI